MPVTAGSACTPGTRVCTCPDVATRVCTGPFPCVRPVPVRAPVWTCLHVPVPSRLDVYPLCKCVYAPRRRSSGLCRHVSVCTPCARAYTVWTWPHVPVPAHFGVYESGRGFTCVHRPGSVCTPGVCVCTRLNDVPRAHAGPFRHVRPVHVCPRVWTGLRVPLPSFFGVYALCTCVYS